MRVGQLLVNQVIHQELGSNEAKELSGRSSIMFVPRIHLIWLQRDESTGMCEPSIDRVSAMRV